jgi:hypothetical protein
MSIQVRTYASVKFADAWLQTAKAHMRVEADRDDNLIRDKIKFAADHIERFTGQMIIPREIIWRPSPALWCQWGYIMSMVPNWSDYVPSPNWPGIGGYGFPQSLHTIRAFRAMIAGEDRSPAWQIIGDTSARSRVPTYLAAAQVEAADPAWTGPNLPNSQWTFYLLTGWMTPEELPPGLGDALLRQVAHTYENRELMISPGMLAPDVRDLLMTQWVPRC